jgi:hypothetical protein
MSTKKIVFVLGAGSSVEFGDKAFPIGEELLQRIEKLMNHEIQQMQNDPFGRERAGPLQVAFIWARMSGDFYSACEQIRKSILDHSSIDDCLNEWSDRPAMQNVGKLSIAHVILEAERRSSLRRAKLSSPDGTQTALSDLRQSWLGRLRQTLRAPHISRRHLYEAFSECVFINFNYDWCLEKFLFHAIQTACELDATKAAAHVQNIPIYHPYGSLGTLQYMRSEDGFGAETEKLWDHAQKIHTYNEEACDQIEIEAMQGHVASASHVIFLGFGFHPKNVGLLFKAGTKLTGAISATIYQLSPRRQQQAYSALQTSKVGGPSLSNVTCSALVAQIAEELMEE